MLNAIKYVLIALVTSAPVYLYFQINVFLLHNTKCYINLNENIETYAFYLNKFLMCVNFETYETHTNPLNFLIKLSDLFQYIAFKQPVNRIFRTFAYSIRIERDFNVLIV